MLEEQFSDLLRVGAVTREGFVVTAHPAINTVLATEIRDLDDGAHKYFAAKFSNGGGGRPFVEFSLLLALQPQQVAADREGIIHDAVIKRLACHGRNPFCFRYGD